MPRAAQAWESATGFAPVVPTGKRSPGEPAPRTGRVACRENNGMDLVDWIGQVPRSGEDPSLGERFPTSFRERSIKAAPEPRPCLGLSAVGPATENGSIEADWSSGGN